MLFILRYRKGLPGVATSYVEAEDIYGAEAVGQQYCSAHMNYRYITVEPAVVGSEEDLPERTREELKNRRAAIAENELRQAAAELKEGAAGAAAKKEPPKDVKQEPAATQGATNDPRRKTA